MLYWLVTKFRLVASETCRTWLQTPSRLAGFTKQSLVDRRYQVELGNEQKKTCGNRFVSGSQTFCWFTATKRVGRGYKPRPA
jgi:hypothetical protein